MITNINKFKKFINEGGYQDFGDNGDADFDADQKVKSESLYDQGFELFKQGKTDEAEALRQQAIKIGSWLGWTELEFPKYSEITETSDIHSRLDRTGMFAFIKGDPATLNDFIDSLKDSVKQWIKKINDTTIKVYDDGAGFLDQMLFLSEHDFGLRHEFPHDLNKKVHEGYLDPVSATKMQKKVDEVNALIAAAKDTDGDPIGVIDSSSTWQAEMRFKPVIFKNGFVYTEYTQTGETKPNKERYKPSDSYDAYQWLSQIATWYRRAMKKAGLL